MNQSLKVLVDAELVAVVEDMKTMQHDAAIAIAIRSEDGSLLDVRVSIYSVEELER